MEAPPRVGRTPGSAEPGRLPGDQIFGRRIVLIFSKVVADVFLLRDGGNRPLKLSQAIKGGLPPFKDNIFWGRRLEGLHHPL
jgi:hypothetical protein